MSTLKSKTNKRTSTKTLKNTTKIKNTSIKKPTAKFVKSSCAPTSEKKDYTCYSDTALTKMKN